ncbi:MULTISPECIES: ABC transporter permease [Bifidobacterium]|jgi:putative ABC transport system permease protein|uniref:ABC transporter permease n=1 Tax=Bifidobacterium tibiigranuli TaxID=2172043 RepID=A0A5N6S2Y3_9BIFI|nr:ABC transporter permease [Bifidobacterium tibiigranuli]KAE8128781.1 ABC transporter permease [Bifidobacterium tibiigranuli]KAE8128972.1 ABC transporter ATP-binding protein [Bifidobacterium tibiigranuli]MCI1211399.1 ABC transporter permease [Bifidobacterium tibiigranuli]MCI1233257.1 ABC transporter permease [Bifidobacterium tibiigranuli]
MSIAAIAIIADASATTTAAAAATTATAAAAPTAAGSYPIDIWGLVITVALVAIAAGMSIVMRLGVGRQMLWATLRSLIQLLAMGYIIKFVIETNNPWLVFALVAVMILAAIQITLSRASNIPKGLALDVFLTLLVGALLQFVFATQLIVRPHPWYAPQIVVTMTGMLLGNMVAAIAVAMSRFFDDMASRRYEIEMLLSLGATPFEAAKSSIISSVKLGMIPTISQLASSGIVLIPGMMAGQVIAGADPLTAAKYQFVVLAIISALTLLADSLIMLLVYRKPFTALHQYVQKA